MRAIAGLCLALAVTACGSTVDDVEKKPVAYTMKVPAAWDRVGTCIAQHYASGFEATYLPVASEQRAKVIVKLVGPGIIQYVSILYIFEIAGGPETTVVVRHDWMGSGQKEERATREMIERCGKV